MTFPVCRASLVASPDQDIQGTVLPYSDPKTMHSIAVGPVLLPQQGGAANS